MPEGVPSIDFVAGQWDGPRDHWAAAFTPGNERFSGHLPTLVGAPDALARTYYLAAWQAVRGDAGPRAAALLEPAGTRARLLAALARDAGDFRAVEAYLVLTGELDLLAEKVGAATVLDHLRALATAPDEPGTVAVDAARVGRGRALAALLRRVGEPDEAAAVELAVVDRARGVLGRYAGGGQFRAGETPDDFCAVAAEMPEFLDLRQRAEMVEFADRQLRDAPPGPVAYALCRLGRPDRAVVLLTGAARPGADELEAILAGLFGIRADFAGWEAGTRRRARRGLGRLHNGPGIG
ncbi:hypothetical protein [Asanoa sp. NPDC050611]|uniref:hypothetical protein n=1 Tax=Asanoa sp. NPDC050611 TaxID=3157098 RepID=UPI0033F3120E